MWIFLKNMWVSVYPSDVEVEMDWKLEDIFGKMNTWKKENYLITDVLLEGKGVEMDLILSR